jgi:hypothetical protein
MKHQLGDVGVDGRIILNPIIDKCSMSIITSWTWLEYEPITEPLQTSESTFGFHKKKKKTGNFLSGWTAIMFSRMAMKSVK